jgi:hypothetical protein
VTAGANEMMAPIHDRMPVMLADDAWERWLDPGRLEGEALAELKGLLVPSQEGWLRMYPVSRLVNNVRNEGPELVQPISEADVAAAEAEATLGGPARPSRRRRPTTDPPDPQGPGLFDAPPPED